MKGLIFTYFITFSGSALSIVQPYQGFLVYVGFSILKPESLWFWSVPVGNYSRIVALALLVGWVINGCGSWSFDRAAPIVLAIAGFWVWSAMSAAQSPHQDLGWGFVEQKSKIFLPFMVGMTLIDSRRKVEQLAWVILLSHGYVAYELNMSYLGGFNRVHEIGFGGMDNNSVSIAMVTCAGLGFFLGMGARKWWSKAIAFGSTVLIVHVVQFSFSRGGMLGLIFTGMTSFLIIPKTPKHYLAFCLSILLFIRLAGSEVRDRFVSSFADQEQRDASANSRVELWGICVDLMKDYPIFGVGPDQFTQKVKEYGRFGGVEAHTLWLQTGAETGIPGLFFLASFYGACILCLLPLATDRSVTDPWPGDMARMVIASLSGFIVSAQFVSLEGLEVPYYIVLIGAGTLMLNSLERSDHVEADATRGV